MVVWEDPKATDGSGRPLEATCKPNSSSKFPIGNTTVVCKTLDTEDRKALCTFEIIVKGKYKPYISVIKCVVAFFALISTMYSYDKYIPLRTLVLMT